MYPGDSFSAMVGRQSRRILTRPRDRDEPSSMHVCVFEPDASGHRLAVLRHLLPAWASLAHSVTLATTARTIASPEFAQHLGDLPANVTVIPRLAELPPAAGTLGMWMRGRDRWHELRRCVAHLRPDRVYLPYADGIAQVAACEPPFRRLAVPLEIELFRATFAYPADSIGARIKRHLAFRAAVSRQFATVHLPDALAFDAVVRRVPAAVGRVKRIPEAIGNVPAMSSAEARAALGLPIDGRIIGCVGVLDERKGVDRLIRAFARANPRPTDRLLLAGKASPAVLAALRSSDLPASHVHLIDRTISNDELATALRAMDVFAAVYYRHIGSASLVLWAAAAQRLVLGSESGWIGATISRFGLGLTCNSAEIDAIADGIQRALAAASAFTPSPAASELLNFHTIPAFCRAWTAGLREQMGLAPWADSPLTGASI